MIWPGRYKQVREKGREIEDGMQLSLKLDKKKKEACREGV